MRTPRRVSAVALLIAATIARGADLTADMTTTESVIEPVSTQHTTQIGSVLVHYTATFAEMLLSKDGRPQATLSSIAYVRDDASADRPVIFAFNGGPGASSSPLHFGALGPSRWSGTGDSRQIVQNPFSPIDVADLVFIDPVGTGFSRARPGGDPTPYWSIDGDAQAVLALIGGWLKEHQRTASPVFIVGESYGGFRLATMAKQLDDLKIAGLIFVSPLLDASAAADAPGNDLPFVYQFPSLAAAAWYHDKVPRKGRTIGQVFDEAARFAQTDYLVALQQGAALPAEQRKKIAARMSALCGLSSAAIEAANLRIDSQSFLETLLADRNLLVGRVDTRVTAAPMKKNPDRPPAADDPALGLKGSNVIKSTAIKKYLADELGVKTSRDYLSLTLDVNFRWNWRASGNATGFYVNPTPNLAALMTKRPDTRVLLLGGYYDLATPLLAPRFALTHAGVPLERITMHAFEGGHSPFEGEHELKQMSAILRDFMRTSPKN